MIAVTPFSSRRRFFLLQNADFFCFADAMRAITRTLLLLSSILNDASHVQNVMSYDGFTFLFFFFWPHTPYTIYLIQDSMWFFMDGAGGMPDFRRFLDATVLYERAFVALEIR